MKKLFSLLMAVAILCSLALPASAASLTFNKKDSFTVTPGISNAYDLFDEQFKSVMPGDKIVGYITVKGNFRSFSEDSLKVWMKAVPHNADGNKPVTEGVGDVADMNDFLNKLDLRVYNENESKTKPIFEGQANELDGLQENVYLGSFRKNGKIILRVELDVPIELGNEFAHRTGEVDWLFTVEAYDDPSVDNPKTGDYILRVALPVMAISGAALLLVFFRKKKRSQ